MHSAGSELQPPLLRRIAKLLCGRRVCESYRNCLPRGGEHRRCGCSEWVLAPMGVVVGTPLVGMGEFHASTDVQKSVAEVGGRPISPVFRQRRCLALSRWRSATTVRALAPHSSAPSAAPTLADPASLPSPRRSATSCTFVATAAANKERHAQAHLADSPHCKAIPMWPQDYIGDETCCRRASGTSRLPPRMVAKTSTGVSRTGRPTMSAFAADTQDRSNDRFAENHSDDHFGQTVNGHAYAQDAVDEHEHRYVATPSEDRHAELRSGSSRIAQETKATATRAQTRTPLTKASARGTRSEGRLAPQEGGHLAGLHGPAHFRLSAGRGRAQRDSARPE